MQHGIAIRVEISEAQIFKRDFHVIDAKPISNRCIDFQCFTGDARLFFPRHRAKRFHVVHSVCQFDQDHANVLDHSQHHFAETLGLRLGPVGEMHLVQFADGINQRGYFRSELVFQLRNSNVRVFDNVVENRSDDCLRVEMHVGQRLGNGNRVGNIGRLICGSALRGQSRRIRRLS